MSRRLTQRLSTDSISQTTEGRLVAGEIYSKVGAAIRSKRDEIGMTQSALAERTGLGRTSITNIERGGQSILVHQLVEIAKVLKADPRDFLVDVTKIEPQAVAPSREMANLLKRLESGARGNR
jgi:transcriptional regulator with XRE-family HTH domain